VKASGRAACLVDAEHLTRHQIPAVSSTADQRGLVAVSRPATASDLLSAALAYAAAGWPVFPCEVGGKPPVTVHGFKNAVSAEDRIREWWHGKPFNIGMPTGSGTADVLDIDNRPDGTGWAAFGALKAAGLLRGAFRLVRTPSGGGHLYFAGTGQRGGSLKGLHIDFQAAGRYVLVPPSQVSGRPYQIIDDRPQTGVAFDWQAARTLLCPPRPVPPRGSFQRGTGSAGHLVAWLAAEPEGNRNHGLFWACCAALEAGDEAVVGELEAVALSAGLTPDEVRKTIGSAYKKVGSNGR
jgi:hypothetical protein